MTFATIRVGAFAFAFAFSACKPRQGAESSVKGTVAPGEDSNAVRAIKSAQGYAERYLKAHEAWDQYFRQQFDGRRRDFSADAQRIRNYVMDQVSQNGRYQGQLDDSKRDGGYDEAVDAKLQATIDALAAVDVQLRGHPAFTREYGQSGVADASKAQLPLLRAVADAARTASVAVVEFENRKKAVAEAEKAEALATARRVAELQEAAAKAAAESMDFCSPFADPDLPKTSLARFEPARDPMQFWLQSVDPTMWQGVPPKSEIRALVRKDGSGRPTFDAKAAYDLIGSNSPTLKRLVTYQAGVSEGYTIAQHTLMVLDLLARQMPHSPLFADAEANQDIDFPTLMIATLYMHDIGKGVPVETWNDKNYQHEFTLPVLENMMCQMGFTRREVSIASKIVSHDLFGAAAKASSSRNYGVATAALKEFETTAREIGTALNVPAPAMFELQNLLYVCDSASYKFLRTKIYCDVGGRLELKVPDLRMLRDRINGRGEDPAGYGVSPCNPPQMALLGEP